ncbi:MAG: SIR2 family protein [Gammaproteobacteria bacterium 28-57-27]|nr:MAG: SIR2 family protein [Gammaproteobacteria bacterium 28-57-27]
MSDSTPNSFLETLRDAIHAGDVIPCIGALALADVRHHDSGAKIPASSDELILAMNNGQPMSPRLMYEFPRAAMHVELKSGRNKVNKFLTDTYAPDVWSVSSMHEALFELLPPLLIDLNRDTGLQRLYAKTPHTLVVGIARIGGTQFRYKLFKHDGTSYSEVDESGIDPSAPVLFKPLGTPMPEAHYIASDADFVDYITELMGGFAIPDFLKTYRQGKRYALLGFELARDTERMILSDLMYASAGGWAFMQVEPSKRAQQFCTRHTLEIVQAKEVLPVAA